MVDPPAARRPASRLLRPDHRVERGREGADREPHGSLRRLDRAGRVRSGREKPSRRRRHPCRLHEDAQRGSVARPALAARNARDFCQYLDAGYRVVDFAEDEARTRGRYLLTTIRPDP